ncbi:MAG: DNA-directed RNA polymerase subunit B'' [Candidatus Diapherotrites archaeon]|nr:DNA-directed RNA polymerase subunit B'' [Candidatus Diapherotrites archaeon]
MDRDVILNSYFESRKTAQEQIQSYNSFLEKMQSVVDENRVIDPKVSDFTIKLGNIRLEPPHTVEADGLRKKILPYEARLRSRSYNSWIYMEMTPLHRGIESNTEEHYIGQMPILTKSNMCYLRGLSDEQLILANEDPMDSGGYFITNGTERFIGNQEETTTGKLLIKKEMENTRGSYTSQKGAFKARVTILRDKTGGLKIVFPHVNKAKFINILKALGLESNEEISASFKKTLEIENDLLVNFEDSAVNSREEALKYLGHFVAPNQPLSYKLQRSEEVLDQFLLPNIGTTPEVRPFKIQALIRMAETVVDTAHDLRSYDDWDNYANKRIITTGPMMEQLFRQVVKRFVNELSRNAERTVTRRRKLRLKTLVQPAAVTQAIMTAVNTGIWSSQMKGVTRTLQRTNFVSTPIDFKRVVSGLSPLRAPLESRLLHGTHWGKLCCVETPDNENCGLTKNLATLASVTIDEEVDPVLDALKKNKVAFGR